MRDAVREGALPILCTPRLNCYSLRPLNRAEARLRFRLPSSPNRPTAPDCRLLRAKAATADRPVVRNVNLSSSGADSSRGAAGNGGAPLGSSSYRPSSSRTSAAPRRALCQQKRAVKVKRLQKGLIKLLQFLVRGLLVPGGNRPTYLKIGEARRLSRGIQARSSCGVTGCEILWMALRVTML